MLQCDVLMCCSLAHNSYSAMNNSDALSGGAYTSGRPVGGASTCSGVVPERCIGMLADTVAPPKHNATVGSWVPGLLLP